VQRLASASRDERCILKHSLSMPSPWLSQSTPGWSNARATRGRGALMPNQCAPRLFRRRAPGCLVWCNGSAWRLRSAETDS